MRPGYAPPRTGEGAPMTALPLPLTYEDTPMFRPAFATLAFTALVAMALFQGVARAEEEIQGIALVKVQDPKKGTIPDMVSAWGSISPSSGSSSTLSYQRDGLVQKFHVEVGDPVKKGQELLEYETAPDVVTAYQQAEAIFKLTQSTRDRTKQLYAQQLATHMDLDNAEHAVLDA